MAKRTKLTPNLLRKIVLEERERILNESDPIEAGIDDVAKVNAEEKDADEQQDDQHDLPEVVRRLAVDVPAVRGRCGGVSDGRSGLGSLFASRDAHAEDDVRVVVARARRPAPLDPHRRVAELPLLEVGRLDAVAGRALGAVLLGVDLEDDVLVGVLLRADADQDVVRVERELTRAVGM